MWSLSFILGGYLSGSILYANVFAALFGKDILSDSRDGNPGTANAFMQGGFWCGALTLLADLAKGFFPVFLYLQLGLRFGHRLEGLALVLAAPVLGHIFPVFYGFKGGKGIAVTFGSLLGLAPNFAPALALAFSFITLSLVIRISPHFYRTLASYGTTLLLLAFLHVECAVWVGFLMITAIVFWHMHESKEQRGECEVKFLWRR